jgi:uncharacterized damage-inducible protein DinB
METTTAIAAESISQEGTGALRQLLHDLLRMLMAIPPDAYTARVARTSGTVGEHVRHALDHVAALFAARPDTNLSYDQRVRGTAVEVDPCAAMQETLRLDMALDRWRHRPLDVPVRVVSTIASGHALPGWSTFARELAFVMSHTIHHQAMIALLLEQQGIALDDERFGYAPSTPMRR